MKHMLASILAHAGNGVRGCRLEGRTVRQFVMKPMIPLWAHFRHCLGFSCAHDRLLGVSTLSREFDLAGSIVSIMCLIFGIYPAVKAAGLDPWKHSYE